MFEIPVSSRARAISDSITLAITARAKAMRAEGKDVVSLGAGEPDFPTPDEVADAGVQAIRDGHTRYTAAAGIPELRAAAAKWFARHFGLEYAPEEIVVTAGAKPALTLCMMALLDDGDRVLPERPPVRPVVRDEPEPGEVSFQVARPGGLMRLYRDEVEPETRRIVVMVGTPRIVRPAHERVDDQGRRRHVEELVVKANAIVAWVERTPRRRHEADCDICQRRPR